jgi:hypothetical protein
MWLAVLIVGIFGPDFTATSNSASTSTTVPSVVPVAICALLATVAVAHAAFRRPA